MLLVDDDPDTLSMYADWLDHLGFVCARAECLHEALVEASVAVPDVLVTDLSLQDGDGLSLLEQLRGNACTRHIPAIALTGWSGGELYERALQGGFARVLTKPCLPDRLAATILELRNGAAV